MLGSMSPTFQILPWSKPLLHPVVGSEVVKPYAAFSCLLLFLLKMKQLLIREHDGAVERVWQTTVAPADHHGTNYELTERAEHAA